MTTFKVSGNSLVLFQDGERYTLMWEDHLPLRIETSRTGFLADKGNRDPDWVDIYTLAKFVSVRVNYIGWSVNRTMNEMVTFIRGIIPEEIMAAVVLECACG